jgi:hypothetical protein
MKVQTTLLLAATSMVLSACVVKSSTPTESVSQTTYGEAIKYSKVDVNANPLDKTVCDPFGGNNSNSLEQGIKASLHYRIDSMPRMYKSEDYVTFAKKSDQKLFFADLNVPTRMFTEGFATQTNDVLKDDSNNKLIEYFGVKFETILKLSDTDEEGDYELALLSDDGTTLKVVGGTVAAPTYKTIIANDGDHPTQMGCASELIHMSKDSAVPLQLTYYQGPRYHIANVLMWRKAAAAGKDALCGKQGNEYFFNPNAGSAELKPYKDLLARGWKVVAKENFFIPKSEAYNPCVEGTKPVITDFKTVEILNTGVFLRWTTDIPATSQVKLINKTTGEVILTQADNGLRLDHRVQVMDLQPGTTYSTQAVSISEDLGNSMSDPMEFTTPGN